MFKCIYVPASHRGRQKEARKTPYDVYSELASTAEYKSLSVSPY